MMSVREKGVWAEVEEDKAGIKGDGSTLDFGWWVHNVICRWCFIKLYTWNMYYFINFTSINSIKNKMEKKKNQLSHPNWAVDWKFLLKDVDLSSSHFKFKIVLVFAKCGTDFSCFYYAFSNKTQMSTTLNWYKMYYFENHW